MRYKSIYKSVSWTILLLASLVTGSVSADPMPEKFDLKGFYQSTNLNSQHIIIHDSRYKIALSVNVFKSDGSTSSLLSLKPDTPVGVTFKQGSNPPVIDKIWILPDASGITPPG